MTLDLEARSRKSEARLLCFSASCFLLLTSVLLLAAISPLHAEFNKDSEGTSSAQFLRLGVGARGEGMAGAYGAVSNDATALYWNPAGLARIPSQSAVFMHAVHVESIFYDFASYALPVRDNMGFGASVQYLSFGKIDETNDEGLTSGQYQPDDLALTFGGGYRWENVSFGASGKYVRATIKETASAATMDAGILYEWYPFITGLSVQNAFGYITFDRDPNRLPLNFKFSNALTLWDTVLVSLDLNLPRDNQAETASGLEIPIRLADHWTLSFRGGYTSQTRDVSGPQGFAAGFGIGSKQFSLDYAWVPLGDLGQTHRISLSIFWGQRRK